MTPYSARFAFVFQQAELMGKKLEGCLQAKFEEGKIIGNLSFIASKIFQRMTNNGIGLKYAAGFFSMY